MAQPMVGVRLDKGTVRHLDALARDESAYRSDAIRKVIAAGLCVPEKTGAGHWAHASTPAQATSS